MEFNKKLFILSLPQKMCNFKCSIVKKKEYELQ